jgi:hypothetical protein
MLIIILAGCAGYPKWKNPGFQPTDTAAVVTVERRDPTGLGTRSSDLYGWNIFLDGELVETIQRNQTVSLLVSNGTHTIYTHQEYKKRTYRSNTITFEAHSDVIVISAYITAGRGGGLRLFKKEE